MGGPVVVITGPTAVGKTAISLQVAKEIGAEIVSADSMQIYRYMNIGTAKPTPSEMKMVRHHMIDIKDPWQEFSVAQYQSMAKRCIEDIQNRGKVPLIVGGTGLYINSLIYNLDFADTVSDQGFRLYLLSLIEEKGKAFLYDMLKEVDPDTAQKLHMNDIRRVIRALEVYHCSGKPMSATRNGRMPNPSYDFIMFGLKMERKKLYERIETRVDKMIRAGLVDEVKHLLEIGCNAQMVSMQGLGYKEIIQYLNGECTLSEGVEVLKRNTRRFAKRQFTWFRRNDRIIWKDIGIAGERENITGEIVEYAISRLKI